MPKYLEEIKNTQPYVLVLGSLMHPLQFFLIMESKAVEQTSLLKAIDACFKAFYVLNVDYPWQHLGILSKSVVLFRGCWWSENEDNTSCYSDAHSVKTELTAWDILT